MKDIKAKILSNEKIAQDYFKMTIDALSIVQEAKPGQFVQVRCSDTLDPLLRRPLSIHRLSVIGYRLAPNPNEVSGSGLSVMELLYEVVGKGTELLSQKKKGDIVDILGPLGNGFTLPPITDHRPPTTVLIAGGIGVAPLVFLTEVLAKKKVKPIVLIGARTKKLILCEDDFKKLGCEVHIATDDGSRGYKGFVSDLLQSTINYKLSTIYACGPQLMLKSVAKICKEQELQCQVCLEEKMACGFGVCLGCAVKVGTATIFARRQKGYAKMVAVPTFKLACKDGPVFNAEEILWE